MSYEEWEATATAGQSFRMSKSWRQLFQAAHAEGEDAEEWNRALKRARAKQGAK